MAAPSDSRPDTATTDYDSPSELGRQRWSRLLPIAFVTYSLAYLDRSNFSIGVAGGMESDLGLNGTTTALVGPEFRSCGGALSGLPEVLRGIRGRRCRPSARVSMARRPRRVLYRT